MRLVYFGTVRSFFESVYTGARTRRVNKDRDRRERRQFTWALFSQAERLDELFYFHYTDQSSVTPQFAGIIMYIKHYRPRRCFDV